MQSAIRAPDPVRERRHAPQVRAGSGGRTSVHIPQIGEGATDTCRAAPSFPYGAATLFRPREPQTQPNQKSYGYIAVRSSAP